MTSRKATQELRPEHFYKNVTITDMVDPLAWHKIGLPRTIVHSRRGVQLLVCLLMLIPIIGLTALAIDMGRLHIIQAELQRSADAAAMAATVQLLHADLLKPAPSATTGISKARDKAIWFASANHVDNQAPAVDRNDSNDSNGDVVVGYLADPKDQNSSMTYENPLSY